MSTLPSQVALLNQGASTDAPSAFVIAASWRRTGPVDMNALVQAVTETVPETEVLGLGALRTDTGAHLVPAEPRPVSCQAFAEESQFRDWLSAEADSAFAFDGSALSRVYVIEVGSDRLVLIRAHHAVIDGYGLTLVMRRIAERYHARLRGEVLPHRLLGDLGALAARSASLGEPDPVFWSSAIGRVGEPGWSVSLTTKVAQPADRPIRHRVVVDAPPLERLSNWPLIAVAAAGAYVAGYLRAEDVTVGVASSLRHSGIARRTPVQWMAVIPTHIDYSGGVTASEVAERIRTWLAAASARVLAGERPERLLTDTPAAWRVGRTYGPTINVVPYRGGTGWDTEVHAWGPVEDCLINVIEGQGRLVIDCLFHRALYGREESALHVEGIADLITASLATPNSVFDLGAIPCAGASERIAIPGGFVVGSEVRRLLNGAGVDGDSAELDTSRGLTVGLRAGTAELDLARAVLPPGVRIRQL